MTSRVIGAAVAVLVAGAACDATAPERLGDPTTIRKVGGDNQVAPPGDTLPVPLVVAAEGRLSGAPRANRVIAWTIVTPTGGTLPAFRTPTDSSGLAAVVAVLPDRAGARFEVRASPVGSDATVTFTAVAEGQETSEAARVIAVSGDGQRAIRGDTLPERLEVAVVDAEGAAVPGTRVNWRITSQDGGSLARRATTTDSSGSSTNRWRVGDTPNVTETAIAWIEGAEADTARFTATVTGRPDSIRVEQGAIELDDNASQAPERVVGDTVTVAPGFWARKPFKATVVDASGETVPGVELSWTVTSGGGTVGDEPDGSGSETVTVNTARDGSITVWRRAAGGTDAVGEGDWIGATLSVEEFPGVEPVTLDALIQE